MASWYESPDEFEVDTYCDDCGGPLEDGQTTASCPHCGAYDEMIDRKIDERRERERFGDDPER
jgi:predicted RNA-binding Zn-ribbon protein involved in translation (DUF1610 family)